MATDVSVPNNFTAGTPAVADDVDANFASLVTWVNTNAVHLDGSKAFTAVPSGPATDPTTANQLTRKTYVDTLVSTNAPRGVMATASVTAVQSGISTITDVTSMTVTWTAVSTRRYRVSASSEIYGTAAGDLLILSITDGSNVQQQRTVFTVPALTGGAGYGKATIELYLSGISGSTTRKLRLERSSGTGTAAFSASSTFPAYIVVEDIGPV